MIAAARNRGYVFRWAVLKPGSMALPVVVAGGSSLLFAWLLVLHGPRMVFAALLLPLGAAIILRKPTRALLAGTVLICVLPYWITIGAAQLSVARAASLCALIPLLFAKRSRLIGADAAVAGFVTLAVGSWLLSDKPPSSGQILFDIFVPCSFYVAARAVSRPQLPEVLWGFFLAVAAAAPTVLYEWAAQRTVFNDPESYSWPAAGDYIFRPGGVFGSPPGAAAVLAMAAVVGLPLIARVRGVRRAAAIVTEALIVTALIATFTRGAFIGFAVGVLFYLFATRSPLLRPGYLLPVGLVAGLALTFALPTVNQSTLYQRGVLRPGTFKSRETFWKEVPRIVFSSPDRVLFGIGVDKTVIAEQGGPVPLELAVASVLVRNGTHNQYLLTLLEEGLVGLALLLAWLALSARRAWHLAYRHGDHLAAGLGGAVLVAVLVQSVGNSLLHPPSFAALALITGLISSLDLRPERA